VVNDQDRERADRGDNEAVEIDSVHAPDTKAVQQAGTDECAADRRYIGEGGCTPPNGRFRGESARIYVENILPLNMSCPKPYF
jgi:hypothetical protein